MDRFNARKGNRLQDARLSLPKGSHSTAEVTALLEMIDRDKLLAQKMVSTAIDNSWIGYADAMGLVYREYNTPASRQILTIRDLRLALKQLVLKERLAALHFVTGYARDVIHRQVMWGATHQMTVEDYVMNTLNARFAVSRAEMKPGHKTCVGQLYSQVYNRKKQKLLQSVLPTHTSLAVVSKGFKNGPHWKRPKAMYFVHTLIPGNHEETKVTTELVSLICISVLMPGV